ncbi:MAG TPA: M20/M25/M40 family metallo-hydrolase [Candidatus Onthomorpha intestinigallinarum]|uniref:M20/M25/M40 family metallo-hydrolase n=1 Tax=Candidatus Onthomorpha intestinigallinarum TaxID=2840880 RepID=A0A9D1RGC8_9BACT|nr:M20/M25/M40 family metallo-hydrolase [Candidatus Onthomorpha intestinigallinarum]
MKRFLIVLLGLFFFCFRAEAQQDEIVSLCSQIDADSLRANVQALEGFGSRYAFNENRKDIAEYLKSRLESYGFDVVLDSFYLEMEYPYSSGIMNSGWLYNVVGKKEGMWTADTTIHLSAHYDAVSFKEGFEDYFFVAPGADDNASGVAAVLEIARIFSDNAVRPVKTLVVDFFAAEEQGLKGSNDRITKIANPQWQEFIGGIINLDMVGYNTELNPQERKVNVIKYDGSEELTRMAVDYCGLYTSLRPVETYENNNASDSYIFNCYSVRAVFLSEHEFTPHYHTERDIVETLDFDYMKEITKLALALVYETSVNNNYVEVSLNETASFAAKDSFEAYPNPVSGMLHCRLPYFEDGCTLSLYSADGKMILSFANEKGRTIREMDLSGIESGIYFLRLQSNSQVITKKVIVGR